MHTDTKPTRGPHRLFGQLLTNAEALREQEDDLIAKYGACAVLWLTAWSFRPLTTMRLLFRRGRNASDRGTSPLTRFLSLSCIRAYSPPAQRPLSVASVKRSNPPRDPRPQSPAKVGHNPTDATRTSTCHALIDTGATTTMIVEKVAEALDLDLDNLDTVEVRGFDGRVVGNYPATDSLWVSVPPFV